MPAVFSSAPGICYFGPVGIRICNLDPGRTVTAQLGKPMGILISSLCSSLNISGEQLSKRWSEPHQNAQRTEAEIKLENSSCPGRAPLALLSKQPEPEGQDAPCSPPRHSLASGPVLGSSELGLRKSPGTGSGKSSLLGFVFRNGNKFKLSKRHFIKPLLPGPVAMHSGWIIKMSQGKGPETMGCSGLSSLYSAKFCL